MRSFPYINFVSLYYILMESAKNFLLGFNINMNINTSFSQNISLFTNWVDSTPLPDMIDTVTYDLYESNNPFRDNKFSKKQIKNDNIRHTVNATTAVGAEFFSVYTNPFYLTHKIVHLPSMYNNVVDFYKKYTGSSEK